MYVNAALIKYMFKMRKTGKMIQERKRNDYSIRKQSNALE